MRPLMDVSTPIEAAMRPTSVCGANMLVMMTPAATANRATGACCGIGGTLSVLRGATSETDDMGVFQRKRDIEVIWGEVLGRGLPSTISLTTSCVDYDFL